MDPKTRGKGRLREQIIRISEGCSVYAAACVFSFIAIAFAAWLLPDAGVQLVVIVIYFLVGAVLIAFSIKRKMPTHKLYLVFAIYFGIAFMLLVPPGKVPDEYAHYYRAFEISEGVFFTPFDKGYIGSNLPGDVTNTIENYDNLLSWFGTNLNYLNRELVGYPNTALYSPLCYIPQTLGILFFRLFTHNAAIVFFGARIFSFAFSTSLIYIAIKILPYGKITLMSIALLPMTLHQQMSVSADGPTIALAIFTVALALKLAQSETMLKTRHLVFLAMGLLILSLSKIVYLLFAFLVLLIPRKKFVTNKAALLYKCAVPMLIILINAGWMLVTTHYFIEFVPGVDIIEQIKFVLSNPIQYIIVLLRTFFVFFEFYVRTMCGFMLGWLDVEIHFLGYGTAGAVLLLSMFGCSRNRYSKFTKTILALIVAGTALLTFSALYAQWTPVANAVVNGIQGRYFLPLLLPLAAFVPQITTNSSDSDIVAYEQSGKYMLYLLMMFANFITLTNCFAHYSV